MVSLVGHLVALNVSLPTIRIEQACTVPADHFWSECGFCNLGLRSVSCYLWFARFPFAYGTDADLAA